MERDRIYLLDILEAAKLAVSYTKGITEDPFLQDTQLQDSVIRRIEIIGEASEACLGRNKDDVYDSTWEASDAFVLGDSELVVAWAKNDHLGFEVLYVYRGVVRKYRPDFLVRMTNGEMLVLETCGQNMEQDKVKRRYLDEWAQAVNAHEGFGRWRCAVAKAPGEIRDILIRNIAERSGG